jgi:hypothetical protein
MEITCFSETSEERHHEKIVFEKKNVTLQTAVKNFFEESQFSHIYHPCLRPLDGGFRSTVPSLI